MQPFFFVGSKLARSHVRFELKKIYPRFLTMGYLSASLFMQALDLDQGHSGTGTVEPCFEVERQPTLLLDTEGYGRWRVADFV